MDLKSLFNKKLKDYVVLKFNSDLPEYQPNDSINILTRDVKQSKDTILDWYDKKMFYHRVVSIKSCQIHVELFRVGKSQVHLRFKLFDKLPYSRFSLHDDVYDLILQNKIHNGVAYVPQLMDDLSLRFCEYVQHIDIRRDKVKHLHYVNSFSEKFYRVQAGECNSRLNYK